MKEGTINKAEILTEVKSNDRIDLLNNSTENVLRDDRFGFESNEDVCFKCKTVG